MTTSYYDIPPIKWLNRNISIFLSIEVLALKADITLGKSSTKLCQNKRGCLKINFGTASFNGYENLIKNTSNTGCIAFIQSYF
jgi:hypothetical protein